MKPAASIKNTLSTWESSHRGFPFDRSIVERMSWPKPSTRGMSSCAEPVVRKYQRNPPPSSLTRLPAYRRVTRRIERQRHEPYPVAQHGGVLDRLLHRVEEPVRKRTAVRIHARGVAESEQRD